MNPPIFILTHPRSGSTLLRYLIDTHPEICSPAELRFGPLCEFLTAAFELLDVIDATDLEPAWERRLAHFGKTRRILDAIMDDYCHKKGKPRWCEKSFSIEHLDHLNAVFSDAQYICLYRNAFDCAQSNLDMRRLFPDRIDAPAAVKGELEAWCRASERLLAFELVHGTRTLRVRYEDMVSDTEGQLDRIWTFLDVPRPTRITQDVFRVRHDGGPGDFKVTGTRQITTDRTGTGLNLDLVSVDRQLNERVTGLLARLGY